MEIAHALDALGVDVIEAGFAASSPGDFEGVRAVAAAVSRPTVASPRGRDTTTSTPPSRRSPSHPGARVHIVLATSPIHMEFKLGLELEEVVEHARDAVAYVAGRVDEVEFACEDATPSDPAFVAEVCRAAIEAGATTVNLPDTVGYSPRTSTPPSSPQCGGCAWRSTASRWPSTATTTWGSPLRTRSRASRRRLAGRVHRERHR